jgi:hypothetical protein
MVICVMLQTEADIKRAVRSFYGPLGSPSAHGWLEEVPLLRGQVRADLVCVADLHCFEIKSERDNLDRLVGQGVVYGAVFPRVSLVVASRHLEEAKNLVPDWWGLLRIDDEALAWERRPKLNRKADPAVLCSLLSRDEALRVLATTSAKVSSRTSLYSLHEALVGHVSTSRLKAHLRDALQGRITDTVPAQPA